MRISVTKEEHFIDNAKVEFYNLTPKWSPITVYVYRFYMNHQPKDHLTSWIVKIGKVNITKYIGSYTPPAWFLKLIKQQRDYCPNAEEEIILN